MNEAILLLGEAVRDRDWAKADRAHLLLTTPRRPAARENVCASDFAVSQGTRCQGIRRRGKNVTLSEVGPGVDPRRCNKVVLDVEVWRAVVKLGGADNEKRFFKKAEAEIFAGRLRKAVEANGPGYAALASDSKAVAELGAVIALFEGGWAVGVGDQTWA